jgi:peptidoglycan-associated lipoprotein
MKMHASVVSAAIAAVIFGAGSPTPVSADARRFRAFVYPDRTRPELSVVVDDFRVNETIWDEGGVQYVWVYGPLGNFQVPFSRVRQIEFQKYLGPNVAKTDWSWYEVHVTGVGDNETYDGRMEIRVMRGIAPDGVPWYLYPATEFDHGRKVWRIVFGDERVEPTLPAEPPPASAPAAVVVTPMAAPPPPPPPPPAPLPTEDDLFAKLSLSDLNAQAPLGDVYFDFDKADLRPDGEAALQRNVAWLKRWPSVKVRIEGAADPRGTNEYNLGLGRRRSETVRDYLVSQGIAANRFEVVSTGEDNLVCTEQTEGCWARNRRGHFVVTAK